MSDNLRIGCVGTSSIMDVISDSLVKTKGMDPVVVYSRDQERGRKYCEKSGIPECMDSYEAMIARPDLDVIYIASPNYIHARQAIAAMKAGKDVIVEKPAGVTEAELREMYDVAMENHVYFLEATTTLFMPNYLRAKQLLPELGKLTQVDIAYGQYSSRYDAYLRGDNPNIFNPQMKAGALNDMGIYCLHVAVDLFGDPSDIKYEAVYGENGIDLEGVLTLTYPDLTVTVRTSKNREIDGGSGCRFVGEKGWIRQEGKLHLFDGVTACIDGKEMTIALQEPVNRMLYEHKAIHDCIVTRDEKIFEEMARQSTICARVLEAAHKDDALGA